MSLIIVTGGIGCGKTTVLKNFSRLGGKVLDADEIVHELYRPGSKLLDSIANLFGTEYLDRDGFLDRRKLAAQVFSNPEKRAQLNHLVHPAVFRAIEEHLRSTPPDSLVFAAVPLWYECSGDQTLAPLAVVATWCPSSVQNQRLLQRNWTPDEIAKRLGSQISADEKARRADYVIMTDCSWEQLDQQCTRIYDNLKSESVT